VSGADGSNVGTDLGIVGSRNRKRSSSSSPQTQHRVRYKSSQATNIQWGNRKVSEFLMAYRLYIRTRNVTAEEVQWVLSYVHEKKI